MYLSLTSKETTEMKQLAQSSQVILGVMTNLNFQSDKI